MTIKEKADKLFNYYSEGLGLDKMDRIQDTLNDYETLKMLVKGFAITASNEVAENCERSGDKMGFRWWSEVSYTILNK